MHVFLACMCLSESYEAAMPIKLLSPLKHTHAPTHPCSFPCSTQYYIKWLRNGIGLIFTSRRALSAGNPLQAFMQNPYQLWCCKFIEPHAHRGYSTMDCDYRHNYYACQFLFSVQAPSLSWPCNAPCSDGVGVYVCMSVSMSRTGICALYRH